MNSFARFMKKDYFTKINIRNSKFIDYKKHENVTKADINIYHSILLEMDNFRKQNMRNPSKIILGNKQLKRLECEIINKRKIIVGGWEEIELILNLNINGIIII